MVALLFLFEIFQHKIKGRGVAERLLSGRFFLGIFISVHVFFLHTIGLFEFLDKQKSVSNISEKIYYQSIE